LLYNFNYQTCLVVEILIASRLCIKVINEQKRIYQKIPHMTTTFSSFLCTLIIEFLSHFFIQSVVVHSQPQVALWRAPTTHNSTHTRAHALGLFKCKKVAEFLLHLVTWIWKTLLEVSVDATMLKLVVYLSRFI